MDLFSLRPIGFVALLASLSTACSSADTNAPDESAVGELRTDGGSRDSDACKTPANVELLGWTHSRTVFGCGMYREQTCTNRFSNGIYVPGVGVDARLELDLPADRSLDRGASLTASPLDTDGVKLIMYVRRNVQGSEWIHNFARAGSIVVEKWDHVTGRLTARLKDVHIEGDRYAEPAFKCLRFAELSVDVEAGGTATTEEPTSVIIF